MKLSRCCKAYLHCAHLSWHLIQCHRLCQLLDSNVFRFAAFLVSLICKRDLRARDQCLSVDGVAGVDEDARVVRHFLVSSYAGGEMRKESRGDGVRAGRKGQYLSPVLSRSMKPNPFSIHF